MERLTVRVEGWLDDQLDDLGETAYEDKSKAARKFVRAGYELHLLAEDERREWLAVLSMVSVFWTVVATAAVFLTSLVPWGLALFVALLSLICVSGYALKLQFMIRTLAATGTNGGDGRGG